MPLYRVLMAEELLDAERRHAYAQDVTRIHCEITGAPPEFVHVLFINDVEGKLEQGQSALVLGSIRAGRTDQQKADLVARLGAALAGHAGIKHTAVTILTVDIPADWAMEGGRLLPEPGAEDDWLAADESAPGSVATA